jgi:hypothetical protein
MITVKHFRDLEVYQGAMEIMSATALTKEFPAEEKCGRFPISITIRSRAPRGIYCPYRANRAKTPNPGFRKASTPATPKASSGRALRYPRPRSFGRAVACEGGLG